MFISQKAANFYSLQTSLTEPVVSFFIIMRILIFFFDTRVIIIINTLIFKYLFFLELFHYSRKNFVCLARKLFWPCVSSYNFTQWRWRIPFCPDDFPGHIEFDESPPNYVFLTILQTGRTYFCPLLYRQQLTTMRLEPSGSWTLWVYTSRPRIPPLNTN